MRQCLIRLLLLVVIKKYFKLISIIKIMYLTTSMGQTLAVSGWPYLRTVSRMICIGNLQLVAATDCAESLSFSRYHFVDRAH